MRSHFNKIMLSINLLYLVTVLAVVRHSVGTETGPSIISLLQYSKSTLASNKIPTVLELKLFPSYATVLPLASGRSWIRSEEIVDRIGKENLHRGGSFLVIPPPEHGMMVVIQELQIPAFNTFNRSLLVIDENGMIMECFSRFTFQIEGKSPVHVCGRTNDADRYRSSVVDGVGPRSFVVPRGKSISVSFTFRDEQIDKYPALSKQVPFYDFGYLFRGSIAFTAYRDCPPGPPYHDDYNNLRLWPCDIPQNNQQPVAACVREDVFCDDVINCGIHNPHEFALDERFCKKWIESANFSQPRKSVVLDPPLLEKAIHSRIIIGETSPDNIRDNGEMGAQSTRPRPYPELGGSGGGRNEIHISPEPVDDDDFTHPVFITLIVLIIIISVLLVGLLFRYCCRKCVGRGDPHGESSNPEALARFHENLRSRDSEANGRPSNGYSISSDTLFKPAADDMPPSYDDLFPLELHTNKAFDAGSFSAPVLSSATPSSASSTSSHFINNVVIMRGVPASRMDYHPHPMNSPIYTLPVVHTREHEQQSYANPAFVHVEILPVEGGGGLTNDLTNHHHRRQHHHHREVADPNRRGSTGSGVSESVTNINNSHNNNTEPHDYSNQEQNAVDNANVAV